MVRGRKQSGVALVYAVLSIVALMGIVSLSVDIGHVQLVKTQLRCAADSAARAAASYVGTVPTARSPAAPTTATGPAREIPLRSARSPATEISCSPATPPSTATPPPARA